MANQILDLLCYILKLIISTLFISKYDCTTTFYSTGTLSHFIGIQVLIAA